MKKADLALYRAKANGGSVYRFYDSQIDAFTTNRRKAKADAAA